MAPKNATECALFHLKAGVNIDDPTTPEGKIWQETMAINLAQPGVQRAFYGVEIENPSNLRLLVQWDDYQDHMTFTKSNEYGPFVEKFRTLLTGPPTIWHIKLDTHPGRDALSSPVTEVLTLGFPSSYSSAAQEQFVENNMKPLLQAVSKSGADVRGSSGGWSVEDNVPSEKSEGGTTLFTALIGWPSVETHHKMRETQEFKDNIHLLREAPELVELGVRHVSFTELQAPPPGAS